MSYCPGRWALANGLANGLLANMRPTSILTVLPPLVDMYARVCACMRILFLIMHVQRPLRPLLVRLLPRLLQPDQRSKITLNIRSTLPCSRWRCGSVNSRGSIGLFERMRHTTYVTTQCACAKSNGVGHVGQTELSDWLNRLNRGTRWDSLGPAE